MIFKAGTYIVNKNFDVILLAEDYNPKTDDWVKYINYFDSVRKGRYKKRNKKVEKVYAEYKDLNGGSLTVDYSQGWHQASKIIINLCEKELERIKVEFIEPWKNLINILHIDIEEYLNAIDFRDINKITRSRIKKIYEKYNEDIYNVDKFPEIFKDLYFGYCYISFDDKDKRFYIDNNNLFPNSTKYLCITDIFSDEKICGDGPITLKTVYENYYKGVDSEVFRQHMHYDNLDPKELIKQLEIEG